MPVKSTELDFDTRTKNKEYKKTKSWHELLKLVVLLPPQVLRQTHYSVLIIDDVNAISHYTRTAWSLEDQDSRTRHGCITTGICSSPKSKNAVRPLLMRRA